MPNRKLLIGDLHGAYKALLQALERANYDPSSDLLIQVGDVVDGWPESYECVEFFMKIPSHMRFLVKGNHDDWAAEWLLSGVADPLWMQQGGRATMMSFLEKDDDEGFRPRNREMLEKFFREQVEHLVDEEASMGIVHGGFPQHWRTCSWEQKMWDRWMFSKAKEGPRVKGWLKSVTGLDRVMVGHTAITGIVPFDQNGVFNVDLGAGWSGRLCVANLDDPKEFWLSDKVSSLYPESKGRRN